jgi:hypothetical protein
MIGSSQSSMVVELRRDPTASGGAVGTRTVRGVGGGGEDEGSVAGSGAS